MSPSTGFLLTASLILTLFGLKLLFGGASQSRGVSIYGCAQRFLQGVGWDVQPTLLLIAVYMLALLVFMMMFEIFADYLIAVLAGLIFTVTNLGLIRDVVDWKSRRFETRLIDGIDLMIPSLHLGNNTLQSLHVISASDDPLIQREFSEVIRRIDHGMDMPGAMSRIKELYDSEGVRLFLMALQAKARYGGDLATTLTSINETMRERLKLRLQMKGQLSGVRLAAFILAVAPYLLYVFFLWAQPTWISAIHHHELGSKLLYGGMALQVAGMACMLFILNSEA